MNKHLQNIVDIVQQDERLSAEQKSTILKSLKEADKELEVATFKLDRTEKVKRTTAILLEETIAELEQKRKAVEAQNRELEIETSLERVRARAMAMHNSEDVVNATSVLFNELYKLGIETLRCGVLIFHESQTMEAWSATTAKDGQPAKIMGTVDMTIHPLLSGLFQAWKRKEDIFEYSLVGQDKHDYYHAISASPNFPLPPQGTDIPDQISSIFIFAEGGLYTFAVNPFSEETKSVLRKFTSVFSLTFRRYQDLKNAETQAREATIEAALEKVRGKAMAMHNSNDLLATASRIFTEVRKLGIKPIRCGVGLLTKDTKIAAIYRSTSSEHGDDFLLAGTVTLEGHPVITEIYNSTISGEACFPVLKGELLKSYYEKVVPDFKVPDMPSDYTEYGYFLSFTEGFFYGWSEKPITETDIKVLNRFKLIIDLTFRRYIELQKAEANALEAVRSASLDRVRAEIASMRTTADLEKITPLIWKELTILNIPFVRCGVFIMDEQKRQVHTFLSTPEGKAIASFHLPYDAQGAFTNIVDYWHDKKIYARHWGEAEFLNVADHLVKQGSIARREQYMTSVPMEGVYLHCLPFLQGMLYVGNTSRLNEDDIQLIQSLADAFSTAYARYEDFNKLEIAKQLVEKTLGDLKQTQALLVQSEKMASLGELTAGIAHEIQNPLNFVNNFSEVNTELIEELKAESGKPKADRNEKLVEELLNDITENEKKIMHHGKRADAIVKGMLQHSRSSSGQKEPTDINALCDEYLRLSFHGLRAKDKDFNARFETNFDSRLEKINVVPQDIGRVILNLINNAFYAVSEKQKAESGKPTGSVFEPTVSVSTKKVGSKVLISVKDNGNGIPQKVLDKIFQPFFTTKPTGQGTGLGLSLSYDIVKAHSGELRVETMEGKGTEFIILLSV